MRVVISPHLDDAVFSVGEHLTDGIPTTIACPLAGVPDDRAGATKYRTLLAEHADACQALGVSRLNGPFLDDVYPGCDHQALAAWCADVTESASEVWCPVGIWHRDHITVALFTVRALRAARPRPRVVFYEELPYRVLYPELVARHLPRGFGRLRLGGRQLALGTKRRAVGCYRSQIQGDEIRRCLFVPERIWVAA